MDLWVKASYYILENYSFCHHLASTSLQDCGADCAKFQKSELEFKFNKAALARPYNSPHSWGPTYGEHKKYMEFSHEQYRELKAYAESIGILMTASGMDDVSIWSLK